MLKKVLTIFFFIGLLFLSSCSSLVESTRKSLLADEQSEKSSRNHKKEVKWVSKAQYDALMERYKNLNDRYEKLKDEQLAAGGPTLDQVGDTTRKETATPSAAKSETVDVFADNGLADQASKTKKPSAPKSAPADPAEVDQELQYFKKAAALRANGKTDEALKIFQYLERSSTEQIRVRARANIGQIYMEKNQYDLALQVFEKMIRNDAFSGKVLEALQGAVVSSEKLQLEQKRLKYQSILRDFFEIEG